MAPFGVVSQLEVAGLDGIIIYFSGDSVAEANQHVRSYTKAIEANKPAWLRETLSAYRSLMLVFDPQKTDLHGVYYYLRQLNANSAKKDTDSKSHTLPVWYGAPDACDFEHIHNQTGLTHEKIIQLHCEQEYTVFAVGFAPGFAYLGEIPEELACPRLATPRRKVPAGAVAIADRQTCVYPAVSPGGWNLLGLCPQRLFDASANPPTPISVGDKVKFSPIDASTYRSMLHE